jgi:hypothetical protein
MPETSMKSERSRVLSAETAQSRTYNSSSCQNRRYEDVQQAPHTSSTCSAGTSKECRWASGWTSHLAVFTESLYAWILAIISVTAAAECSLRTRPAFNPFRSAWTRCYGGMKAHTFINPSAAHRAARSARPLETPNSSRTAVNDCKSPSIDWVEMRFVTVRCAKK